MLCIYLFFFFLREVFQLREPTEELQEQTLKNKKIFSHTRKKRPAAD